MLLLDTDRSHLLIPRSSGTEPLLTAHVHVRADASPVDVLARLEAHLKKKGITHSTIQICNPQGAVIAV